jgi:hypothetical protein
MTTVTFDTLKFVETLRASGFEETQAKGMAAAIQEVQKSNLDEVASKADIQEVKRDIKELELSSKRDIKELEYRLTIRVGLMLVTVAGMLFTALRYFPPTQPIVISASQLSGVEQRPIVRIPPATP